MENEPIVGGYVYHDGARYYGDWNEKGQKHGFGYLRLADSTSYYGYFQENLFSGLGVLQFPDDSRYEGDFVKGWFHGYGVFSRRNGMKFEGQFDGGKICGLGLVTFADGLHGFPRNEGLFQNCRMICRRNCSEVILEARKTAYVARNQEMQKDYLVHQPES